MARRVPALVKPELLVWARESAGISSVALAAELAGIDATVLGEWERGHGVPSIAELRKLGEVYKRPIAVFFLPKPPVTEASQPLPPPGGQFVVYRTEDGKLKIDVRFEGETVWLMQQHMAALFQTSVPNISMHIRNVFAEGELQAGSVVKESLTTAADGKNYATKFYNRDVIISVGSTKGALQAQPRATPWESIPCESRALKGRSTPCHNLSPGFTSISSSAPSIAHLCSTMPFAMPFIATCLSSCKTSIARRSSSTRSRITFTFSLNSVARSQLAGLSKTRRNHHRNGSKRRAPNMPILRGRLVTARLPFPSLTSKPCARISPTNGSITAKSHFRRNIAPFWSVTAWRMTNGMCGIEAPLQGSEITDRIPRALPWADAGLPRWGEGQKELGPKP
jgi:transcriptional regulator with XRE-family HTH domain